MSTATATVTGTLRGEAEMLQAAGYDPHLTELVGPVTTTRRQGKTAWATMHSYPELSQVLHKSLGQKNPVFIGMPGLYPNSEKYSWDKSWDKKNPVFIGMQGYICIFVPRKHIYVRLRA